MANCSSSRQTTGCRQLRVHLRRVGVLQADDVAGELDHGALQAQADAEEGNLLLAGKADGLDLAADAAIVEAARHQHAIDAAQHALGPLALDLLRLDLAAPRTRVDRAMPAWSSDS